MDSGISFRSNAEIYHKSVKFCIRLGYKLSKTKTPETGKWIRKELVNMGPTYIKLGQVVSTRTDLFPNYITDELQYLQNKVPPIPFEDVENVICNEFGNWRNHFLYLSHKSIASASIGQVHLGVLKNKKKVVVKVQKPAVEENIERELNALLHIAHHLKFFNNKQINDVLLVVEEVYKNIKIETDFNNEKENMILFSRMLKHNKSIIIPKVYTKLSSKRMLVMEYVPGSSIHSSSKEHTDVSKTIMTTFIKILIQYGYLHADPHAGNLAITDNGKIILYDFGLVAKYDLKLKTAFREILIGFVSKDANSVINILLSNNILYVHSKGKSIDEITDLEYVVLFKIVSYLFDYSQTVDVDTLTKNILLDPYIDSQNLPFMFDSKMILLFKTMTTLEGVCKSIDPEFNYYHLIDEVFNNFIDSNMMVNKVINDVQYLLFHINEQYGAKRNEIPQDKLSNAKSEIINKELDNRYTIMLVTVVLSVLTNFMTP